MKTPLATTLLALALTGCVAPTITGTTQLGAGEEPLLTRACAEIAAVGDARALIAGNKADVAAIKELLANDDLGSVRDGLVVLKNRIRDRADRLARILDAKYSAENYHQTVRWVVGEEDYEKILPFWARWTLEKARVEASYTPKSPDDLDDDDLNRDLLGYTAARVSNGSGVFTLARPVSALELCQLQGASGLKAVLVFGDQHGHDSEARFKLLIPIWSKQ